MSEEQLNKNLEDTKEAECNNSSEQNDIRSGEGTLPIDSENSTPDNVESDISSTIENDENSKKMEKVIAQVIEQEFCGPIPPPNIIAGYEKVVPGAADRIIKMAEQQSLHRQQAEMLKVKAESRDSLLGVIFAFMLGIGCIIACIIMVILVPGSVGVICGSIMGVTGIGSIVTGFLKNTRQK